MKGHGFKSTIAENLNATRPFLEWNRATARHKLMCWRCQKDKPRSGGYMKTYPGFCKFICADCLVDLAAKKDLKEKT